MRRNIPLVERRRALLAVAWALAFAACSGPATKKPTVAPKTSPKMTKAKPKSPLDARRQAIVETIHGVEVSDPYRWLETLKGNAEARRWLSAHDKVARAWLAKRPDREALRKRLEELSYVESLSAPIHRGKRWFFSRRHKDKEKKVWYWRQGKKGKARVLLDPNTMSKDGSVSLRGLSIAWNGKKVAYKLSANAADEATLYVMDVGTGKVSEIDRIPGAKYAHASWTKRATGFYYTRLPVDASIPVADRPGHAAVYFHKLGTDYKTDKLVHDKLGDPRKFIQPSLSRSGRFLFLYIMHGWTQTDLYFRDLRRHKTFRKLAVGLPAKFSATAHRGRIYLQTNYRAPNFRLFRIDPKKIAIKEWKEIVPERQHAVLKDFSIVGGRLSLRYLKNAYSELRVARLDGKLLRTIKLPGIGTAYGLIGNPRDDEAYYGYSSFIQPLTIYKTSVRRGGEALYFKLEVPVDPRPLMVEQVFYPSKDGTKISMFIVRRKDMPKDGSTPVRLYGYGGFDISTTSSFSASSFVWLDSGGALAYPNLRGGGEYGESWHQAGMLTHKQNVFDDFIAAAEYLIKNGYTKPERLAIRGGSNGGLLVGAAMTQRPELFRAVVCAVPLLDMLRYHLFGSGKTWIAEYGSADDPAQFRALYAYSPYHHVRKGTAYPALLMLTADSDDRVDPMHARKFVAAIRWANTGPQPVLLRVETKAGHGGGDMVKKRVARLVDSTVFLFAQLGIKLHIARPPK